MVNLEIKKVIFSSAFPHLSQSFQIIFYSLHKAQFGLSSDYLYNLFLLCLCNIPQLNSPQRPECANTNNCVQMKFEILGYIFDENIEKKKQRSLFLFFNWAGEYELLCLRWTDKFSQLHFRNWQRSCRFMMSCAKFFWNPLIEWSSCVKL